MFFDRVLWVWWGGYWETDVPVGRVGFTCPCSVVAKFSRRFVYDLCMSIQGRNADALRQ